MKTKIIIASQNIGKIKEYQNAFKDLEFEVLSLNDLDYKTEIAETGKTFEDNAYIKAKAIYDKYKLPVIADDSGLVVKALPKELGVKSKRFSPSGQDDDNIDLLLKKLEGNANRSAYFVTVICLYVNENDYRFYKGKTDGKILYERKGKFGFGYDPVFEVAGLSKTYAELDVKEKHSYSHRGKAIDLLLEELKKI
jgi:XTP/dITP diphosphohydrolase